MEAANIGSAKASTLNAITPRFLISVTGDINPIISGANMYINTPITPITPIPIPTVIRAKLRVSVLFFAPMLCPTNVVAASAIP